MPVPGIIASAITVVAQHKARIELASAVLNFGDSVLSMLNSGSNLQNIEKNLNVSNALLNDISKSLNPLKIDPNLLSSQDKTSEIDGFYENRFNNKNKSDVYGFDLGEHLLFTILQSQKGKANIEPEKNINYLKEMGIQNNSDFKNLYDVVRDGFILNNDLLASIANPSNPKDAFTVATALNKERVGKQNIEDSVTKKELAMVDTGLSDKLKANESRIGIVEDRYKKIETELVNKSKVSAQTPQEKLALIKKEKKEIYEELIILRENIKNENKNFIQEANDSKKRIILKNNSNKDNWASKSNFSLEPKQNIFSKQNFKTPFGYADKSNEYYSFTGQNPFNSIQESTEPIFAETLDVNAENVNIKKSNMEGVKTADGIIEAQNYLSPMLLNTQQEPVKEPVSFSYNIPVGPVVVHVAQIAQISDGLVEQVFKKVEQKLKEQAIAHSEGVLV